MFHSTYAMPTTAMPHRSEEEIQRFFLGSLIAKAARTGSINSNRPQTLRATGWESSGKEGELTGGRGDSAVRITRRRHEGTKARNNFVPTCLRDSVPPHTIFTAAPLAPLTLLPKFLANVPCPVVGLI